jgi:hypothetical protein
LVTPRALQLENESLKEQLAARDVLIAAHNALISERDAAIADRDTQIKQLATDLATLQQVVKELLARRGGGYRIPEGQGVLFSEATLATPQAATPAADTAEADDGTGEEASTAPKSKKPGTPRTPRKMDTTGLPREDRLHDVPESQRVDATTGKPLVPIGEKVFEEVDYQRAKLVVIRHRRSRAAASTSRSK